MSMIKTFLKDEAGAITIEWVALAAGVVILAIGVVSALKDPIGNGAAGIGEKLESYVGDIEYTAPGGDDGDD